MNRFELLLKQPSSACCFNGSGSLLAVTTTNVILLIDVYARPSPVTLTCFTGHLSSISQLIFSEDDEYLLSCGADGCIYGWNIGGGAGEVTLYASGSTELEGGGLTSSGDEAAQQKNVNAVAVGGKLNKSSGGDQSSGANQSTPNATPQTISATPGSSAATPGGVSGSGGGGAGGGEGGTSADVPQKKGSESTKKGISTTFAPGGGSQVIVGGSNRIVEHVSKGTLYVSFIFDIRSKLICASARDGGLLRVT